MSKDLVPTVEPFVYEGRPQRIVFGPGRLAEAPEVLKALGVSAH